MRRLKMANNIFVQGGEWHIRWGREVVNLNSERAAEMLLGLLEANEDLEHRLKSRQRRRGGREEFDDEQD